VQNLYESLELDKDSSFDQYVIKVNQAFNHEVDMYGDIKSAGEWWDNMTVLEFGIPIPHNDIMDLEVMNCFITTTRFNPDIPGCIENVHPNKFIANLWPVEEFRHTPVIPISEKDLAEYKKKIEDANRKGWYLEIKKDSLYFWSITALTFFVIGYFFMVTNENLLHDKYRID